MTARLSAARTSWESQLQAAEAAAEAASRPDAADSTWASAELQLSRLERAAAPFGEIASIETEGSAEAAALAAEADAARARHLEAFTRLRALLRR